MRGCSEENLSLLWQRGYERLAKRFSSLLTDKKDSTLLELGCGRGQLTIPLARSFGGGIIATDNELKNIEALKKNIKINHLNGKVTPVFADAASIELDKSSLDAIVSNFFLGWVDEDSFKDIMRRLKSTLKTGGIVVHSDFSPLPENPSQEIALEQGFFKNNTDPSQKWWSPVEVEKVLMDTGFKSIDVASFDWEMTLDSHLAVEQLKRWGAKPGFINANKGILKTHGMELPRSFIVTARKGEERW